MPDIGSSGLSNQRKMKTPAHIVYRGFHLTSDGRHFVCLPEWKLLDRHLPNQRLLQSGIPECYQVNAGWARAELKAE